MKNFYTGNTPSSWSIGSLLPKTLGESDRSSSEQPDLEVQALLPSIADHSSTQDQRRRSVERDTQSGWTSGWKGTLVAVAGVALLTGLTYSMLKAPTMPQTTDASPPRSPWSDKDVLRSGRDHRNEWEHRGWQDSGGAKDPTGDVLDDLRAGNVDPYM